MIKVMSPAPNHYWTPVHPTNKGQDNTTEERVMHKEGAEPAAMAAAVQSLTQHSVQPTADWSPHRPTAVMGGAGAVQCRTAEMDNGLSHGLARRAGVALDLLELQLAGDLDFRAESAADRDQAVTNSWWAETKSSLGLSAVLEWAARVAAKAAVLIAIQLGRVARNHARHAAASLAGVAWRGTTAEEGAIEIGRLGHGREAGELL